MAGSREDRYSSSELTSRRASGRVSTSAGSAVSTVRRRRHRFITGMVFILLFALAFLGGFLARGNDDIMNRLGITSGISKEEVNPGSTVQGSTYTSISARVAEIEGILNNYSLDSYDLDTLTSTLMNAFVDSTADTYLRYFNQERYEAYVQESAQSGTSGIGVLFGEYEGLAYAVDVFDGGVAQAAGVQQGDFVVAINGDKAQSWTSTEVINAIGQAEGGSIVITWRRPGALSASGGDEFTTTLTCEDYAEPNVQIELDNQVGYISVAQLSSNAATLVSEGVTSLAAQGAEAYVLDLRNCSGGYLSQAVSLANLFIRSGIIVQVETRESTTAQNASGAPLTEAPLILLVNGNTSGAAEVVAAALRDTQRATIIGERTMGKGSVQVIRVLSFGGALRYTAAYYKSPLGLDIDGNGVTPSVIVSDPDQQKTIAIETAQGQTSQGPVTEEATEDTEESVQNAAA